ncbi:MAG TPA: glycoside hydrolase family 3 C-terminal domain-containing protein [Acidimicrobiales bacterium]|nr:glycoside hydrolase family 3 C-terminal domain-containing protein [Acidimicrobiales bacterium]
MREPRPLIAVPRWERHMPFHGRVRPGLLAPALVVLLLATGCGAHLPQTDAVLKGGAAMCAPQHVSLMPLAEARERAAALVKKMNLRQEVDLMTGVGNMAAPSGTVAATAPLPALGIPALNEEDGPAGVGDEASGATQMPAPEALAATFDPGAAFCYGQVIGSEARAKGANLVFAPTTDIVRVPQWGRAFESLGEDPVLAGSLAASEVDGIQGTGTMAEARYFGTYNQEAATGLPAEVPIETAVNSEEIARQGTAEDAVVGAKALNEIYLRAWGQIVASMPAAVMCAMARVNGTWACQDKALLSGFLDKDLGFTGFIGSDWWATQSTVASVQAGLDQEQPDAQYLGDALVAAVGRGSVTRGVVDQAVERVLTQMFRFRMVGEGTSGASAGHVAAPEDQAVATDVAEEGTVLLKDAGPVLPLHASGGAIAVIGPAGEADPTTAGGGSATVEPSLSALTPVAGLRAALGGSRSVTYTAGLPLASQLQAVPARYLSPAFEGYGASNLAPPQPYDGVLTPPETGTYLLGFSEPADYTPAALTLVGRGLSTTYSPAYPVLDNPGTPPRPTYVAAVGLVGGRGYILSSSEPFESLLWATPAQLGDALGQAAAAARRASVAVVVVSDGQESQGADRPTLALPWDQDELVRTVERANPRTVVVVEAGGPVTMPWLGEVAAVLDIWYPGQADGTSLSAVLVGKADPSGHLPLTFPASPVGTPLATTAQYPGQDGEVLYSEGTEVGYRWYEAVGVKPLFPFGYGLSYTSFRYSDAGVEVVRRAGEETVLASVRVTNTGERAGADVAQLYLGEPAAAAEPPRQLEAFQRVALAPGQSTVVHFTLAGSQLGYFSAKTSRWSVAPGAYRVWMGDSSALAQLPARTGFDLPAGEVLGRAGLGSAGR